MSHSLRVLDLTDAAVAYSTRLLADLGAEITRVDTPGRNDGTGAAGRRIALDIRRAEGVDVVARLCATADVVLDGIEPAVERVEEAHARCLAVNPRLVWVAVRPFAPPAGAGRASAEIVRYAQSGLMSITGMPGQTPCLIGGGLGDAVTAAYAVFACLLGCRHARETGAGRLIYVSAHEALATFMQQGLYEAAFSGRAVKRGGNRHAHIAASGALKCQDGYVVVSANERRMWQQLVELVGDDRLRDPALNDERVRMARQAEIFGVLETWAGRFTKTELSEIAQSRGIPIAPVHDVDDLLEDPHLRARRFFHRINGHDVPALMTPWSIPGVDGVHHSADAAGILRDAGFASEEIARLEAAGIVSVDAGSRARDGAPVS